MKKSSRHFDFDAEQMLEQMESSTEENRYISGTARALGRSPTQP
jgi:hypothetical protein